MKTTLMTLAAATLLSSAAMAQLSGTPVPPSPPPIDQPPPVDPVEPGEPPSPIPPEMPADGMMPPAPPAPPAPPVVYVPAPPPANLPKASGPATPTGKAVSGWTTKQDLATVEPAIKDYPPCTRTRKDSCRNPGGR